MIRQRVYRALRRNAYAAATMAVRNGAPPSWFGYRVVARESLPHYGERRRADPRARVQRIHPAKTEANPLPLNWPRRSDLPRDRGWWGYSFWDVPERRSGPTTLATLPNCRIVPRVDDNGEFWVGVLNEDGRALELREMALRKEHRETLCQQKVDTLDSAVWVMERVFHNYSHWLTAHLPKFLLLKELGLHEEALLPRSRPSFVDDSLRSIGVEPSRLREFEPGRVIAVGQLTILDTDRFRPDLARRPRTALSRDGLKPKPWRRVFVSRIGANRRRLLNEEELWPALEARGFERVLMEELTFAEQVRLMEETETLCAPHGAGLTNMMFCQPGAQVIEFADLSFPNPNFYALACAMQLGYWLVEAEGVGDVHPLDRDMRVDRSRVERVLEQAHANRPRSAP